MKKILVVCFNMCRGELNFNQNEDKTRSHFIIDAESVDEGYFKYCKSTFGGGDHYIEEVIEFNNEYLVSRTEHSMLFIFETTTLILEVMD